MKAGDWAPSVVCAFGAILVTARPEQSLAIVVALIALAASPPGVKALGRCLGGVVGEIGAAHVEEPRVERALRGIAKGGISDAVADEAVIEKMNSMIRIAVADALKDEKFMGLFRDALKEALRDRDLHKAALEGVVGNIQSLNPFRRRDGDAPPGTDRPP